MNAENRKFAEQSIEQYTAKYSKALDSLRKHKAELLTFYDFPAEHWQHSRSTNVIESAFATVRLRQRVTKGAGSRTKALLMAFKLLDMAQVRWRRIKNPQLAARLYAGVRSIDGSAEKTEQRSAA